MSTAKSMAFQYKQRQVAAAASRLGAASSTLATGQRAFKSSASNLSSHLQQNNNVRAKSTSMTNLIAANSNNNEQQQVSAKRMQRPASRSALDQIHMGMNAKYAQVQSKVLTQNIRPQVAAAASSSSNLSKIASNNSSGAGKLTPVGKRATPNKLIVTQQQKQNELMNKVQKLEQQVGELESEREQLRAEVTSLEEEKSEQVRQLKEELENKTSEHERQQEEYHQKLLEAYELADGNRRAADSVLAESRQRDEEQRKRIEELERQLAELNEFVSMKNEMQSKMGELREQIREERERYEEKTRSLNQMFESEKISPVDENSNYFRRQKNIGQLQSSESINNNNKPSSLRQSERDLMYGSKLSTRMQDTAKSAWKKSRKFASSMITSGLVGVSACRRNGKNRHHEKKKTQQCASAENVQSNSHLDHEQCTSVIEVGEPSRGELANQQQQQQQQQHSEVKVDENNKLTIVTKFNQLPEDTCCPSERSRCESSSSGRGTNSASESGAESALDEPTSVNGANPEQQQQVVQQQPISPASSSSSSGCASNSSSQEEHKRHKRRSSSLFKTSKVFSGSQASLNKLRSFFAVAASTPQKQQQQQQESSLAQLRIDTDGSPTGCQLDKLNGQALEDMLRQSGQGELVTDKDGDDIIRVESHQIQHLPVLEKA